MQCRVSQRKSAKGHVGCREKRKTLNGRRFVDVVGVTGGSSSSVIARSIELHNDVVTEPRRAPHIVVLQDPRNLMRSLLVVLADDLDAERPEHRAVLRNTAELDESALPVARHLNPDLEIDLLAVESRLRLVDSAATDGVAVVGALLVVSEVDDGHHGAVRPDVCLDEGVGEGVVAVLAALVRQAFLVEDLRGCLLGGELPGGGQALGVGASDLGEVGESGGVLCGGLVGPQLADLLVVLFAQGAVGFDGLSVGTGELLEGSPLGRDGRPGVEGRDGQVDSRPVDSRNLSQGVGSSIGWEGDASERGGSDGRLLARDDGLGHPGYLQDRVADPAAVDGDTVHDDDIVAEGAGAVVVLVGTHGRDWLGGDGMCFGRVRGSG